ncbi:MAG: NAD-dependent epimerase/dehydratase family protein [Janthinobacterium lividum]
MTISKRVLVTGLNGFTGRYMQAELETAGFEVFGIGEAPSTKAGYFQANLTDVHSLRKALASVRPHIVIHLAGIAFVGNADAQAFYAVNTVGTRNLLEAIAQEAKDIECVLLASSANVYGNTTGGELDESVTPNPANDYAVSKLAMEYIARLWFDRLPIVICRPFNYTGIGQSDAFLLPKIVNHFKRGACEIELGNIDVFRDFSDVRAVVNAYRRLVELRPAGTIVNVSSGITHSLKGVISIMSEVAGYAIEVKVNPAFVRANEVLTLSGSPVYLRSLIGGWASPPLRETLEWMYRSAAT